MADNQGEWFKLNYHRHYLKHAKSWVMFRDFADGSHEAVVNKRYIPPYKTELMQEAESQAIYANRLDRTVNINVTGPILDEHVHAAGKSLTIQGFEGDKAEAIKANVNGFGESAQVAFRRQLELYFRDGFGGILIENDRAPQENTRSFQVRYEALSILNWRYFEEGNRKGALKEILLQDDAVYGKNGRRLRARRYYFEDEAINYSWEILESEIVNDYVMKIEDTRYHIIERGNGELPVIPFVITGMGPNESAIKDVAPINKAILNRNSILSNINYHQGFRVPVFTGVSSLKDIEPVAEYLAVVLPNPESSVTMLDAGDPVAVREERNFLMHWAKRIGMRQFKQLQDDMTRQTQSAESKAKDLHSLEDWYNETLDFFEGWLEDVYRMHARFENVTITDNELADINVSISRDFELTDTAFELQKDSILWLWANEMDAETSAMIKKALLKKYASEIRLVPGDNGPEEEERQVILKQVTNSTLRSTNGTRAQLTTGRILSGQFGNAERTTNETPT